MIYEIITAMFIFLLSTLATYLLSRVEYKPKRKKNKPAFLRVFRQF